MGNNKNSQTAKQFLDTKQEIDEWLEKNWKVLAEAVAKFAIFCPPAIYVDNKFIRHSKKNLLFCRKKASQTNIRKGTEGKVNGQDIIWDDNSAINYRFKKLTDMNDCKNYTVCHIYGGLAHQPNIFSATANLVLLPNTFAGLSDHCDIIKKMLAHRAYQLFHWHPESEGFFVPEYNKEFVNLPWKDQVPDDKWESDKPQEMEARLRRWAQKKDSIVYRTIQIVKEEKNGISRKNLIAKLSDIANNPRVTISSLMSETGNSYGNLFYYSDDDEKIRIRRDFQKIIDELWN